MVSYSNKGDQFGGLLSNVSGVDSSAFQKKALKDVKAPNAAVDFSNPPSKGQARPAHGYADLSDMSRGQSNSQQGPQSASQRSSSASSASAAKSDRYVYNATAKDSSMQFGGILGDLDSSKHSRPMRKATEPVVRPPSALKATPPHEAVSSAAGPFNNDLDDLFGVPARQQPPMSASPDADSLLAAFEDSSMSSSGPANPSACFSTPHATIQPAPQSRTGHKPVDDLLGGFEGSLGVEDHSTPEPVPEPEMPGQMHDTQAAAAGADDGLDIFAAPVGRSQDTGTLSSKADAPADINGTTPNRPQSAGYQRSEEPMERRKVSQARPSPRQSSKAAPAQATEDEGSRASPPAGSNGNISSNSQDFDSHRQCPANAPKQQQGSFAAREESHGAGLANKDNAKEWLDKGQKWLLGAGKKLAAAAKEAQSTIQTKLEDMEVFKSSQGKGQMWSPSNDAEIPEYYRQWAAAIGRLRPEEQMRTLAQMSEEDRLIVQRLMDRSSMQASGAQGASRPEAPAAPSPDRAGRRPAEAPPQQRVRPGSSGDLRSERRDSPAEPGPARRSSSYNMGDRARDASPEPLAASSSDAAPSRRSHAYPARATPPSPVRAAEAQQPEPEADFLGFSGPGEAPAPSARPQPKSAVAQAFKATPAEPAVQPSHEDFLDMSDGVTAQPNVATPSSSDFLDVSAEAHSQAGAADGSRPTTAAAQSEDDLLGGFSRAQPAAAAARQPASGAAARHADIESLFGAQPASQHRAGASMIDFGNEAAPEAVAHVFASPGDVEVEGEPELRRQLRARRLAEKQAQMAAALAEKQARDVQESTEKERKVELREENKQRMAAWRQGKDGNLRALLASLDTVLWEGSGWKKPSMTDLVDPKRVKRAYMMANLVVHPDKVKQKGGTVEQIVVADIAFDTLKTAWAKFEAGELRS